ncbi:GNAT family N-acetyltransferase [Muricauda sp. CAU 1633]|uniref:GNAT family N-acetyltransferase n=1 Tax=Allomuricauda sp. CAU 1633 TaxID=2816036 RepID=UPI001A8FAE6A|nr:GNAT family N-acetyltransferase [Muricauda sp. CAU 1633]MBO0321910.1 GNAT family N-acetyltransferase [Muricauda sp. CAU 1633]
MKVTLTTVLTSTQKQDLFRIWNAEYFQSITYTQIEDFEDYLAKLSNKRYLLLLKENHLIGCCVKYRKDNASWFFILLDSKLQGKGLGSKLLDKAKEDEMVLNGWVIPHDDYLKNTGEPYKSPLGFYQKNGFEVHYKERLELDQFVAVKIQWKK